MMKNWGSSCMPLLVIGALAAALLFIADNAFAEPEFTFSGEFRINSYIDSRENTDEYGDGNRQSARLRWRPSIAIKANDSVSLYTQFDIGQINENFFTRRSAADTRDPAGGSGEPVIGLRHAYLVAGLPGGVTGVAGIVPVPDKVGSVLFDSNWEFSPLALAFFFKVGEVNVRAGVARADEGNEFDKTVVDGKVVDDEDDYDGALLDLDWGPFGASVYTFWLQDQASRSVTGFGCGAGGPCLSTAEVRLMYYALRYSGDVGGVKVNAVAMFNTTDAPKLFANLGLPASVPTNLDTSGYAVKGEVIIPVNDMTISLMGWYAQGDADEISPGGDADAFLTPMSLVGLTGYWGYTGKLNVQGSTDTGIDEHLVNIDGGSIDNNSQIGWGLINLQAKIAAPISDKLSGILAISWMQSADTPDGVDEDIGIDVFAQGTWHIAEGLNFDFGVDYLAMGEGHYAAKNRAGKREDRTITTVFSRLQLTY